MGELISELKLFNWSIDAFESVKILTEFQNADIVKERALMKTIHETQLKILKRIAFVDQLRRNDKDFKQINEMQNMAQELCNRVKEMGELINMLLAFNLSQDAFESLKLLKELQEHEMAKTRVLPKKVGDKVTNLDLLGVIKDEELMGNLCDEDAVRVCLLLSLEVIFMVRLLVDVVDDSHMRLVENIKE
nr:phospholipase-like protein [Tanacetum cinerariifolium]